MSVPTVAPESLNDDVQAMTYPIGGGAAFILPSGFQPTEAAGRCVQRGNYALRQTHRHRCLDGGSLLAFRLFFGILFGVRP